MEEHYDELHQLDDGDPGLPAQVLLGAGDGGQHVVAVHDDVHQAVDEPDEGAVAAGEELGANPRAQRHHGVVVHVQEGQLVVLLAEDEEHRV